MSIAFELYENGISRALMLDYGDFVIAGEMSRSTRDRRSARPLHRERARLVSLVVLLLERQPFHHRLLAEFRRAAGRSRARPRAVRRVDQVGEIGAVGLVESR